MTSGTRASRSAWCATWLAILVAGCGRMSGGDGATHFVHCETESDCTFGQTCAPDGTCADVTSGWQKVVELDSGGAAQFKLASGVPKSADLAWYSYSGGTLQTRASSLRSEGGWSVETLDQKSADASSQSIGDGFDRIHIVQQPSGEPLAVWSYWHEQAASDGPPRWSRYEAGAGWSPFGRVVDTAAPIEVLAVGPAGDVLASFSTGRMVQLSGGAGWAGPDVLAPVPWTAASSLVVDSRGTALIDANDNTGALSFFEWSLTDGWRSPSLAVPTCIVQCADGEHLVGNSRGDRAVAWVSVLGDGTREVRAAVYVPEAGWSSSDLVASSKDYDMSVQLSMDPDGATTLVWTGGALPGAPLETRVFGSRRERVGSWNPPTEIDAMKQRSQLNWDGRTVWLSAGTSNRAIVVWYHGPQIEAVRWTGSEWTKAESIYTEPGDRSDNSASAPSTMDVAMDRAGNAAVAWIDTPAGSVGAGTLRVARFIQ